MSTSGIGSDHFNREERVVNLANHTAIGKPPAGSLRFNTETSRMEIYLSLGVYNLILNK